MGNLAFMIALMTALWCAMFLVPEINSLRERVSKLEEPHDD